MDSFFTVKKSTSSVKRTASPANKESKKAKKQNYILVLIVCCKEYMNKQENKQTNPLKNSIQIQIQNFSSFLVFFSLQLWQSLSSLEFFFQSFLSFLLSFLLLSFLLSYPPFPLLSFLLSSHFSFLQTTQFLSLVSLLLSHPTISNLITIYTIKLYNNLISFAQP